MVNGRDVMQKLNDQAVAKSIEATFQRFAVGETIRMPHFPTVGQGRYRVWQIVAEHLGGTNQEGTYEMVAVDILENERIHVPCVLLESHPLVEKVTYKIRKG